MTPGDANTITKTDSTNVIIMRIEDEQNVRFFKLLLTQICDCENILSSNFHARLMIFGIENVVCKYTQVYHPHYISLEKQWTMTMHYVYYNYKDLWGGLVTLSGCVLSRRGQNVVLLSL